MDELSSKICAVLLAAGSSRRFGSDKLEVALGGQPVWLRSFRTLLAAKCVDGVGIVTSRDKLATVKSLAPDALFVVEGGSDRQASSRIGVASVPSECEIVLIHDAARPFVTEDVIDRVVCKAIETGAAFPAISVTDTIRQERSGGEWVTLERESLALAQTPQAARRDWLVQAHAAGHSNMPDDVELLLTSGYQVVKVVGDARNVKLTFSDDFKDTSFSETRTGFGYDVHRFSTVGTRPLWLGGVEFDDRPGLEGHSDADALIHAIVDALLGAAALGDIGVHYPPSDAKWKDCRSTRFLEETSDLLKKRGWHILNIDATVVAERPKVMVKQTEIRSAIADACGIEVTRVSVKATTNEGLGAIGNAEGIACHAVATICR